MGDPQLLGGGTPSVSAKRSAEQKCGIKIGGTKIGRTKIWWGPMAEQKMVGALGHWVAGGPLVQVQKGQWNKNAE